ncbi:signal transduction histidine kinase [Actinoplanes tereljensis]|uniref:histidine kinase n=1 Tax=Paractinoplanes tereljensis TaxID=571912 RepID=A0A919NSE4_9ACTN|nr:HAMP domain-containing sensor histidine kinase [Actinoplanes tereljensis]GIF23473.1 two-component sensor histidine kinase [Actinoplanes tereljensis]
MLGFLRRRRGERLRRRLGVRLRSALAAAVVVAVASLLAGGVLLVAVRGTLLDNINTAATDRSAQVTAAVKAGSDLTTLLRPTARERTVVQVLDASGQVESASDALTGQGPISALRPADGRRVRERHHLPGTADEPFQIVAEGVSTASGTKTVLVAESLDTVDDGTEAILIALLLGLPMLAVVVGFATFLFVGRTLLPVEAMSRQAALITSRNLHQRLPVPSADDEIATLAATMNTMLDRIEAASDAQRRFVGDASHELRSPLATVQANADLLTGADLPEQAVRSIGRIRTESARMARLVEDLLLLARMDDVGLRSRQQDVDLDDLVYTEQERLALEHPSLQVRATVEPVRITGDADALLRVVRNLIDNSARHAVSTVTINVNSRDGYAETVIGNDGPPIPAADRDRIFDRFVRLDDSRARSGGGTGLGLAIARDIVAAHGGTLTVDDLDAGAAMRIRLPLPVS